MTASPYRYERKFLVEDLTGAEVEAIVRLHPALFREVYAPRIVNNVYFDSPGFASFHDNVEGSAFRTKARVRWYGEAQTHLPEATLELKEKRGLVGTKHAFHLTDVDTRTDLTRAGFPVLLERCGVPADVSAPLRRTAPVLRNRYRRRYFLSADGRFRITLDTRLQYLAPDDTNGARPRAGATDPVILELKYATEAEDDVAEITSHFPFRLTKSSKYTSGVKAVRLRTGL